MSTDSSVATKPKPPPEKTGEEEPRSSFNLETSKSPDGGYQITFPNGGRRAWLVVLGSMLVMGCSFGYLSAFGVYESYYLQNQLSNKTPSDVAWIGSLQVFFQFASGLLSGGLFDMYGARAILIPASIVYVFAIMMTSLCKEYYQFILAQGVLGGIGLGFLFTPATGAIGHYFREKRGMALGIVAGGSSIGGVLFPIALRNAFYSHLGFEWGVRVVGFVVLALLSVACVLIKERLPHRKGKLFHPRAFLQPSYTFFVASVFLNLWGMFVPFFFLSQYALEKIHMGYSIAFYLLSILNGVNFFGRLIPGMVADKVGRMNMFVFISAITAVITFCLPQTDTHVALIVWTVFFGFFSGAIIGLFPAILAELAGNPQLIGTYIGQGSAVFSFAGLTGTPIAGAILDKYGWESLSIFAGVAMLAGSGFGVVGRFMYQPKLLAKI